MIKIKIIYICLLIFGCAYQGPPGGGPKDVEGPSLMNIFPDNLSKLENNQNIILTFSENIKPTSIINSIFINSDIKISSKVKSNKIIIEPLTEWPENKSIEINLNRDISDFQLNNINENIQLIYNIDYDYCSIKGYLENFREDMLYNIFAYEWPINNLESPIKKINANDNGEFEINYLKYGEYSILASEGNQNIYNNYYGMISIEAIELNQNNCDENISMYIDKPLDKVKITRVETVNTNLLNIFYNNDAVEPYLIDSSIGDSIYININKKNRLHEYELEPYLYIVKEKTDTIPPTINLVEISDSIITVNFSEPILLDSLSIMTEKLEGWVEVEYNNISPMAITLLNSGISRMKFFGNTITDFNNNQMSDSIKVYDIDNVLEKGNSFLSGKVNNRDLGENVIIEANNISLNLFYRKAVEDSSFVFKNLHPGEYVFRAYEQKNEIDSLIYFSGLLNPYQRAARFSVYKDTIEVRDFWDIEGINIGF